MFGSVLAASGTPNQVQANTSNVESIGVSGTVYAGLEYNSSGAEHRNDGPSSTSFTTSRGKWLYSGSSSSVWVQFVITSGALNWENPGTGRLQLNTSRKFGISRSADGVRSCTGTFNFYDASSGGNLLDSVFVDFEAERGAL